MWSSDILMWLRNRQHLRNNVVTQCTLVSTLQTLQISFSFLSLSDTFPLFTSPHAILSFLTPTHLFTSLQFTSLIIIQLTEMLRYFKESLESIGSGKPKSSMVSQPGGPTLLIITLTNLNLTLTLI